MSAFYAECPSKRFYVNGTVGTKTKFLGLSVKAQNNGTGIMFTIYYQSLVAHGRNLFGEAFTKWIHDCSTEILGVGHLHNTVTSATVNLLLANIFSLERLCYAVS